MAVTNGWGQGVINNTNGFGKLATNNIGAGSVYENSASGDTVLVAPSAPSFASTRSFNFDGVDDFIQIPYNSIFNQSVYSFSFWIKNDSNSTGGDKGIICADTSTRGFAIQQNSQVLKFTPNISSGASTVSDSDFFNTTSTWIHCALTFDGTDLILYKNGVSAATQSSGTLTLNANNNNLTIGNNPFTSGRFFDGNIDEVSIFNSALSSSDVTFIYNSGVPNDISSLNPLAWYRCGENANYKSPQWLMPENSNKDKFSNYSFEFDGVNDTLNLGNITALNGTNSGSFSMWLKLDATGILGLFNQYGSGSDRLIYAFIWLAGGRIDIYISGNLAFRVSSNAVISALSTGEWFNLVITYDGSLATSTDRVKVFINTNELTGNIGGAASSFFSSTTDFIIGHYPSGTYLNGNVDEFAIFTNTLSSSDISSIYNSGVPNDISSLSPVAHYRMGEEANFTNNWLINNSALSNYSTRSFQFDGVDDFMSVSTPTTLTDFTTSVWLHRTANGNFDGIFGQDSTTAKGGILRYVSLDGTNITLYLTSGWTAMSGALAIDTWHHFALTYDSTANELKSYINGSLYITITSPDFSGQSTDAHSFSRIGMRNGSTATSFPGLLDEIALWNTAKSASDITDIYNSGEPTTITGAIAHWRMGEEATFNTNWTIPNQVGNSTVASVNMDLSDLVGNAPNYTGAGLSNNMTIEDRVGDAPNSSSNAVSFNMTESDRETDVPS